MKLPFKILLFDIDSVLVEPLGYRAALIATLQHFADNLGIGRSLLPDVDTIEYFEAKHITSEWDMAPIILAVLLNRLAGTSVGINFPSSLDELHRIDLPHNLADVEYRETIDYISEHLANGEFPATTALRFSGPHRSPHGSQHPGIFPHIARSDILGEILSTTRDPYRSIITRIFQHHTLGSQVFSQVYGLAPEIDATSTLLAYDKPLLPRDMRESLISKYNSGELAIAAITNRPSYPPREVSVSKLGYPPEAEMALELNELRQIPLIGFGRLRYVAEQLDLDTEAFLKPSPVHILSAIFTAITGQEYDSIKFAAQYVNEIPPGRGLAITPELNQIISELPGEIHVHVYEDTRWGIDAAFQASKILGSAGISNHIYPWGIANNHQKVSALKKARAEVFPNISEALRYSVL